LVCYPVAKNKKNGNPNTIHSKESIMKYGARNNIEAKVISIKRGDIMSLAKFEIKVPVEMGSVLTSESVDHLDLKPGDTVNLVIKAINVLPVKE
jgi:molybdate transport system regulatory protein